MAWADVMRRVARLEVALGRSDRQPPPVFLFFDNEGQFKPPLDADLAESLRAWLTRMKRGDMQTPVFVVMGRTRLDWDCAVSAVRRSVMFESNGVNA